MGSDSSKRFSFIRSVVKPTLNIIKETKIIKDDADDEGYLTRRQFLLGGAALTTGMVLGLGYKTYQRPEIHDLMATLQVPENGSYVAGMAAALLQHELDVGYCPSTINPFKAVAVSRIGFQMGVIDAVEGTAYMMKTVVARLRNSSDYDPDIDEATTCVSIKRDKWNIFADKDAKSQFRLAVKYFDRYNKRLSMGKAEYEKRTDSLIAYMGRDESDFGKTITVLSDLAERDSFLSLNAQKAYYRGRGLLWANHQIYKAMAVDFEDTLSQFRVDKLFNKTLSVMQDVSMTSGYPVFVLNGRSSGLMGAHLENLAGGLTRVRQGIKEITESLGDKPSSAINSSRHFAVAPEKKTFG